MLSKSTETSALNYTVLKLSSGADHKTTQLTSSATRPRLALLPQSLLLSTQMATAFSGVFKSTLKHSFQQVSPQWSSSVLNGSQRTPHLPPMVLSLISFAIGLKNKTKMVIGQSTTTTPTYLVDHGQVRTLTLKLMENGTYSALKNKLSKLTNSGIQTLHGNKLTPKTNQAS
jgi:hypothetical protein